MDFFFEQLCYHFIDVNQLVNLKHVPLDDVIFVLRRACVDLQPLRNFNVQQRVGWHQSAVRCEVFVVRNQWSVELGVRRKKIRR